MLNREEILAHLKKNKEFFKKKYDINEIILFGSVARDEIDENSDIDLAIVTAKKNFKNRFLLKEHLENEFKCKIDLGYLSSLNSYIREKIAKEAIYV